MDEIYLKQEETFFEYPDKYLRIKSNSNLYYIEIDDNKFVARSNIDSLESTLDSNVNILTQSFYSVLDGMKVLSCKRVILNNKVVASTKSDVKIIKLSKILNLTGNSAVDFSLDDINTLLNFKEEKAKQYRKFYF